MGDGVWFHSNFQIEYVFEYQQVVKQVLLLLDVFHLKLHLLPTNHKTKKKKSIYILVIVYVSCNKNCIQ